MRHAHQIRTLGFTLILVGLAVLVLACHQGGPSPTAPSFDAGGLETASAPKKGGGGKPGGGGGGSSDDFGLAIDTLLGDVNASQTARTSYETGFAAGRKGLAKAYGPGAVFTIGTPDLRGFIDAYLSCTFGQVNIHNEIRVQTDSKSGQTVVTWEFVAGPGTLFHRLMFSGSQVAGPPNAGESVDFVATSLAIQPGRKRVGCTDRNDGVSIPIRLHNFGPS